MTRRLLAAFGALLVLSPAAAQAQSIGDVLTFLLINRSVATGDFVRDEQAAVATRDAIADLLAAELSALPISSSAAGFVYQLDPSLGVSVRTSENFGPFFSERALTGGAGRLSFAVNYQPAVFTSIDGRNLRDGSLVATAAHLTGEPVPFDVESLTLHLRTDTLTLFGTVGLSDRLDVGAALPLIRVQLSGTRVDNYRGTTITQATASGDAFGPGDVAVRAKFSVYRVRASGVALSAEGRLPSGDETNLLGSGVATVTPRLIGSWEGTRISAHGNAGLVLGRDTRDVDYRGAFTVAATPRVTAVIEAAGRRFRSIGRLTDVSVPHPTIPNVETLRLDTTAEPTHRLVVAGGVKWNVASTWLMAVKVQRPVSNAGLNTSWVPTVTLDYSFER